MIRLVKNWDNSTDKLTVEYDGNGGPVFFEADANTTSKERVTSLTLNGDDDNIIIWVKQHPRGVIPSKRFTMERFASEDPARCRKIKYIELDWSGERIQPINIINAG